MNTTIDPSPDSPINMGVYCVSGVNTGSGYIGGSTDLARREREQFSALRNERHHNPNLQNFYLEAGGRTLQFIVLQPVVDSSELARAEEEWIARLTAEGRAFNVKLSVPRDWKEGYKLSEETRRKQSLAKRGRKIPIEKTSARRYRFQTPTGEIEETLGLRSFAEKHELNLSHLSKVARGDLKHHKGFKKAP